MRSEGLRSKTGYGRRPGGHAGKPSGVSPNHLQRQFDVQEPNKVWITDITYLRTYEGGCSCRWSWTCSRARSLAGL